MLRHADARARYDKRGGRRNMKRALGVPSSPAGVDERLVGVRVAGRENLDRMTPHRRSETDQFLYSFAFDLKRREQLQYLRFRRSSGQDLLHRAIRFRARQIYSSANFLQGFVNHLGVTSDKSSAGFCFTGTTVK